MSEYDNQVAVFDWIKLNEHKYPVLKWVYATANGGKRHIVVAHKLKKSGVRAGVWDILCHEPSGEYNGLAIEMKFGANKLTNEQTVWGKKYKEWGYLVDICYTAEEAIEIIKNYIKIKKGGA